MFNKLKSFSEDVAKSFNEIQQGDAIRRNAENIQQLKKGQAILSTNTPGSEELVQPEDETTTSPSLDNMNVAQIPIAQSGPLKDVDLNELPILVRAKLKKYVKYEEKYPVLLDAFKTEKRKGELVIAFEKVLKECTPVSTISDAGLLVDYLNSLNEKSSLLDAELRKTAAELTKREKEVIDLSKQLASAEKTIKYAEDAAIKAQEYEKTLENEKNQLTDYIKKFETQLTESNLEIERLKIEAEKVSKETHLSPETQDDVLTNENIPADFKKELDMKNDIIQNLESKQSSLEQEIEELKKENTTTKSEKEETDLAHDKLRTDSEKIEQDLSQKLKAASKKIDELTQNFESGEHKLAQANEQLEKLKSVSKDLVQPDLFDDERKLLMAQVSELTQNEKLLKSQLEDTRDQVLVLSGKISTLQELEKELKQTSIEKESTLEKIQLSITDLQQNIADLESEKTSLITEVENLRLESSSAVEHSKSCQEKLDDAEKKNLALETQIAKWTKENDCPDSSTPSFTSSQTVKGKGKKKRNGKSQVQETESKVVVEAKRNFEDAKKQIEELKDQNAQLLLEKERVIKEKEEECAEKEMIIKKKEALLSEEQARISAMKIEESPIEKDVISEKQISKLQDKLKDSTEEINNLCSKNDELRKLKEAFEQQCDQLIKDKEQLVKEQKELTLAKDVLESEKTELFETISSLENENYELNEEKHLLCVLRDEALEMQSKLDKEKSELSLSFERLKSTSKDSSEKLKELESQKTKLETEQEQLKKNLAERKREISAKEEEIENLRDLIKLIGDDLVTAKDQLKEWKNTSENELEQKSRGLEQVITNLKSLLEKKEKEIFKLDSQVQNGEEKLKEFKELTEKQKKELKDIRAQSTSLNANLEAAQKEVSSLTAEKQKLNERVDELAKFKSADSSLKLEIASMQSSISHKDEQIKELKETVEKMNKERDELNDAISSLKTTNGDLMSSNKSFISEKSSLMSKHEMAVERTNALNSELLKLQISRQKVVTEYDALKLQHDSLVNSKSKSSGEVQTFKQQCEELSMKVKEAQKQIENLEDDLFEARNMLQERTRESSTIRKLLIDAEEQSNIKTAELKTEIRSVTEEKNEIESQLLASLKKKQRECDEFKDTASHHATTIKELEKMVESLNAKYEPLLKVNIVPPETQQKQKDLEGIISELRISLSDASKKIQDYENINSVLKKLNEETSLKFERLSKNYKQITQQYRQMQERKSKQIPLPDVPEQTTPSHAVSVPYLKNVLVGFLEHREQREQLLPVMKTLFELNDLDEQKLMSALK